jgi:hypothetical protein
MAQQDKPGVVSGFLMKDWVHSAWNNPLAPWEGISASFAIKNGFLGLLLSHMPG